jgi:peptidoglycan/LPS O-acetylase OafA/YrhL
MSDAAAPQPKPLPAPGLYLDRYDLIDAWRGLAALGVCFHHVTHILIGGPAVMLFFVISGYCIAASADACQRKGWGFTGFMWRRIRRIYPPYLFSIAFWALTRLVKWKVQHGPNELARPWTDWLQNLTLTQWLSLLVKVPPASDAASNKTLFAGAYWSLCYEEQFYFIMGLMVLVATLVRATVLQMSMILLAGGVVWNVLYPTTSFGVFIECWSLFAIGVLTFHRLCRIRSAMLRRAIDAGFVLALAACVYVRWFAGHEWPVGADITQSLRNVYEELVVALAFALVLIGMRPVSERIASLRWYKPLAALGHITFSLYLIHQFNLKLMVTLANKVICPLSHLPAPEVDIAGHWHGTWQYQTESGEWQAYPLGWLCAWFLLQFAGHIAMASVFWYFCERPFLNKSIIPATGPAEPQKRWWPARSSSPPRR